MRTCTAVSGRYSYALAFWMLLLGATSAGPAYAQEKHSVVARVNGVEIRETDLALAEATIGGAALPLLPEKDKREYLIKYLVDILVLAQAAEAKGLAEDTLFKQKLALARNQELAQSLMANTVVSETAVRNLYEKTTKEMALEKEVRARHILVETEVEANKVLNDLKLGADFEMIAKLISRDPTGASNGGDLGYFTKDAMVKEFADAAFRIEIGELGAVKSQFGWHIIKVEDKRVRPLPSFDEVKDRLQEYAKREALNELIVELRNKARIELPDTKN